MITATFKASAFALFLLTTIHAHSGEALLPDNDIENPAIMQEAPAARPYSAYSALACASVNVFTAAFQYYTLSACNELCNESFKNLFNDFLTIGICVTGLPGVICLPAFRRPTLQERYFLSVGRTWSLSTLSLCASFSCGLAALKNPNHFAVINGSGVATAFATGLYLLRKGYRQSREQPSSTNLIEDLLEPETQI